MPLMIMSASASVGGSTFTAWNRRSRARSFSIDLAKFRRRRRTDALNLAARERRLQDICGIKRSLGRTGSDERMKLVDKDNVLAALFELGHDLFQTFLELAAVFRSGNDERKVERENAFVLEKCRNVLVDDPLRQALDDRRLAHARFADQNRIVLGSPAKDLDKSFESRISRPTSGSSLPFGSLAVRSRVNSSRLGVLRIFFFGSEHAGYPALTRHLVTNILQPKSEAEKYLGRDRSFFADNAEQQMLGADMTVLQLRLSSLA